MTTAATKITFAHFDVKAVDENAHTFSGLASTWDRDLGGDVIRPGAFKRTLRNWKSSKRKVPLVDSHNVFGTVTSVVGQLDEGEENREGLLGNFAMIPEDQHAEAVFRRVKGGYVDGLSIGYEAVRVEYPKTDEERAAGVYRYLDEVKLREISVVLFPMNPSARIDLTTAKAALVAARDRERELDEDEVKEMKAIMEEISDLLQKVGTNAAPPPPVETALADPTKAADLVSRITRLQQHGLATRLATVQHSGHAVLKDL